MRRPLDLWDRAACVVCGGQGFFSCETGGVAECVREERRTEERECERFWGGEREMRGARSAAWNGRGAERCRARARVESRRDRSGAQFSIGVGPV